MDWKMLLACVTGSVEEELLLRNEYLATENRIWRNQFEGRVRLTDAERRPWLRLARNWVNKPWKTLPPSSNLTLFWPGIAS